MARVRRLPRRWRESFDRYNDASAAALNIALLAHPDYDTIYTPFLGDALPGEWAAAKTNGTAAAVTVASSQLTLTSGTDDNGYAGQGYGLFWKGDNGFFFEIRGALDTLTTAKLEIGVSDATDDAGAVNVKATPSATATDFAVVCFDTDDNTDLDLISQKASGVAANKEDIYTLVGGTNFTVEMSGQNDVVSTYVNGAHVGADAAIEGGTSITPWVFAQSRAASASRIFTAEYMFMTGPNGMS